MLRLQLLYLDTCFSEVLLIIKVPDYNGLLFTTHILLAPSITHEVYKILVFDSSKTKQPIVSRGHSPSDPQILKQK